MLYSSLLAPLAPLSSLRLLLLLLLLLLLFLPLLVCPSYDEKFDLSLPRPAVPAVERNQTQLVHCSYFPLVDSGSGSAQYLCPPVHDCRGATGRYVRIQLNGARRIFDADVDVTRTKPVLKSARTAGLQTSAAAAAVETGGANTTKV